MVNLMTKRDGAKRLAEKGGSIVGIVAGCKRRLLATELLSLGDHDNNNNSEKKGNNGGANGTAANGNGGGVRGTAAKAISEASVGNGNGAAAPLQSEEGKRALVERILGSRTTSAVAASLGEMRTMEARAEETLAKTSRRKEELTARRNAIAAD